MNPYELQVIHEEESELKIEIDRIASKIEEYKDLLSIPLNGKLDTPQKIEALEKRCNMYAILLDCTEYNARMLIEQLKIKQKVGEHFSEKYFMNQGAFWGGAIAFGAGIFIGSFIGG